jgi:small subunit ribosomal protein S17
MSDDETKKDETTEETPVQDEDATSAGPVEGSDSSSSQAAGEEPDPTPPAEEAPAADAGDTGDDDSSADDAPAEEAVEAPAAEASEEAAPAAEPNPEDELPWKERRRLGKSRRSRKARAADPEERKAERVAERKRKAALRRKQRAAAKAAHTAGTGTPAAERESNAAKMRQGIVVSSKGDKSITVRIDIARRHRTYEKIVRSSTKLHAHDERNEAGEGDVVRVVETRPLSKTKRWRLVDVVEKAR